MRRENRMDVLMTALAKIFEISANISSESASAILMYQPKKPECLCKKDSDNE